MEQLKVIELASVLAGPAVGMFFAELGAQVIKVENKSTQGDVTRSWRLPAEKADTAVSAYYASVNWGKAVWMMDLRKAEDRQRVHEAVREADIVISNFKPASARRMQMDAPFLQGLNPRLIYAQLHAFGPEVDRPAFDIVLQAEAGFLYMTGEADREPVRMPVALIDLLAAHQLKEGILLALLKRQADGVGRYIETSLFEAAVASLANQATNWLMAGHLPERMGTQHPNIAPYGDVFYTKDKLPIVLAAGTQKQFEGLCHCLQGSSLAKEERFLTNAARVRHREALKTALAPLIQQFDRANLMALLQEEGVPAGSIRNMKEVFEQEMAQRMILEQTESDGKTSKRVRTIGFKMTKSVSEDEG